MLSLYEKLLINQFKCHDLGTRYHTWEKRKNTTKNELRIANLQEIKNILISKEN